MAKKTYVVKEKDNLASLSKALGVSIRDLQQANGIRNLTPGQTLTVPRNHVQKTKNQAGIYTTGEGERKTVTVNGQQIRLAPNSQLDTRTPQKNKFQSFLETISKSPLLQGFYDAPGQAQPSSVRGSAPSKSFPGLASPVQYTGTGLGVNSQMGGYQQANQQTYFGSYGQGAPFSANQNALRQQALGLTQPVAPQLGGRYAPMAAVPQQNMLYQNAQNAFTGLSNNANIGPMRAPNTFSYAPQGQPNSYTPYSNMFPNLNLAPNRSNTGNIFTNQYVTPPAGSGLSTPPPAFNQANFQSGANRGGGGKRWWIGSGKTHGENNGSALAAQQAAMQAINMNPGNVQQTTWRPIY